MPKELTNPSDNKASRPSFHQSMMDICITIAHRATCLHREQGAIIVKNRHILSTGYNGAPSGQPDCLAHKTCAKEISQPCRAEGLHGESNAIISAAKNGVCIDNSTMYCVFAPCQACCNMIKNAGITTVIYLQEYSGFPDSKNYLDRLGIEAHKLSSLIDV